MRAAFIPLFVGLLIRTFHAEGQYFFYASCNFIAIGTFLFFFYDTKVRKGRIFAESREIVEKLTYFAEIKE